MLRLHSFPPSVDRRRLLKTAAAGGLLLAWPLKGAAPVRAETTSNPFTLGVASGDPSPDGFVIWTRLAPQPLEPRGGMSEAPVEVQWQVATDPSMSKVVREGKAIARIELAHSVHVELDGLEPGRDYFYRFRAGDAETAAGRARTLPPPGAAVEEMRFAAAGCQQWEGGYYTAWRAIADDHLDFVFHYGDYIYERPYAAANLRGQPFARVMPQDFATCYTLTDYRRRYSLYKTDPDLQAAHASCPFLTSFDDHEVADNWAATTDPKSTPAEAFLVRRAAAFQAWYEHSPVRRALMPMGPDVIAYRRFAIGNLADVTVLDTRQYRSKQPCGDGFKPCAEADSAARTMMGVRQEAWLAEGLRASRGTWQVIAQQVLFAHFDWRSFPWVADTGSPAGDLDAWDGATAARDRMLALWREAKVQNPVVLTGDVHRAIALDLHADWREPSSPCLGVEFVATSIASGGDGSATTSNWDKLHANNPHLKFTDELRGYNRHIVTPRHWQADFRVVERISAPGQPVTTKRSLAVEAGKPGVVDA